MEKPLIDQKFQLEKFPGKGGWTFAGIPKINKNQRTAFGWVKVKGTIDGFPIKRYSLMPMGEGKLFLPVKAEIRKKIKKQEGDLVHVILFKDEDAFEVPEEMLICLKEEPIALEFFKSLSESEQRLYVLWVYSAKKEETRVDRLAKSVNKLLKRQKLYDKGR